MQEGECNADSENLHRSPHFTEEYFSKFDNMVCEYLTFKKITLKYEFGRSELIEQF